MDFEDEADAKAEDNKPGGEKQRKIIKYRF
jgi:hypothetical protein